MTTNVLWQLAQPTTDADRRRARLVSTGVAGCGIFLLAAIAILSINDGPGFYDGTGPDPGRPSLAPYLAQPGLRGGTAFGAALLVVPFVLFGLQALRTGTAARERRLAALSLAGATRTQLRRLAFLEGTRAAVIGAVLAGPGYLAVWVIFGRLLPDGWKMLPTPALAVGIGWLVMIIVLAAGGGLAARLAARPATVSPLGLTRRRIRPLTLADAIAPLVSLGLIVLGLLGTSQTSAEGWLLVSFSAMIVLAVSGGPWMILLTGRIAVRQRLVTTMAGRRLLADVRSPGRVVGVLFAVGIAFGVIALQAAELLVSSDRHDVGFYLTGYAAAAAGGALACVVASSSLVVGATEQVLDSRRGTAVLVALAASPRFVVKVVRRQLLLAAVPAAGVGALFGWLAVGGPLSIVARGGLLALLSGVLGSALAAMLGALAAARAVRPAILEASTPDNLRAP
jgi:hypothetical protein